jgi:hypothetical protein
VGGGGGGNPTLVKKAWSSFKVSLFHVFTYKNVAVPGSVLHTANGGDEGEEKEKGEEGKKKGSPRPPSDGRHGIASQTAMV